MQSDKERLADHTEELAASCASNEPKMRHMLETIDAEPHAAAILTGHLTEARQRHNAYAVFAYSCALHNLCAFRLERAREGLLDAMNKELGA